jgi:hypothetical protein
MHTQHAAANVLLTPTQGDFRWFLALSVFWSLYNMIPPSLFIFYLFKSDGLFEDYVSFCYVASFILGVGGIACTWLVPGACLRCCTRLPLVCTCTGWHGCFVRCVAGR